MGLECSGQRVGFGVDRVSGSEVEILSVAADQGTLNLEPGGAWTEKQKHKIYGQMAPFQKPDLIGLLCLFLVFLKETWVRHSESWVP